MSIPDCIHEWKENMKPRIQRIGILAETFHDVRTLLGHDDGGFGDDVEHQERKKQDDQRASRHAYLLHRKGLRSLIAQEWTTTRLLSRGSIRRRFLLSLADPCGGRLD